MTDEDLSLPCGLERGECPAGAMRCANGVFGACEGATEPTPEVCDALDDDCDGNVDGADICAIVCGAPGQDCCLVRFHAREVQCIDLQCR